MKIASNTPISFRPKNGYEFIPLGEGLRDADAIILMLEKNWGSGSIDKIKAITYWVSSYASAIPCYIIGCESTIPDKTLERYRHKERDDAVRALCDEVLGRSSSIGVRGEITSAYLTDLLGYEKNKVDIIYDSGADDNLEKLTYFLEKNRCPLDLEKSLLDFQARPYVLYERSIDFDKNIKISRPYVMRTGDVARLSADFNIDGEQRTLWCETDDLYHEFLSSDRSDAFLTALLPLAMRIGKDIVCEAPVTEQFLHNLTEILIPHLCAYDARLYCTKITADVDSSACVCGGAVATGMSCGVDSLYTANLYNSSKYKSMNLTHLYCGNYLYGNDGPIYERAELAARHLNVPLIRTATNLNEVVRLPHLPTHFFKAMFGVLALRRLFSIYYYSSGEDFSHFNLGDNSIRDTAEIELLLLYVFSAADFQLVTGGAKSERLEKTRAICAFPLAHKVLNVCLYPELERNCGKCAKCRRTLLTLDMLDSLDLFHEVFYIDEYRRNRIDSFVYLISQKRSIMLSVVYKHFLSREPHLIRQAEDVAKQPALTA